MNPLRRLLNRASRMTQSLAQRTETDAEESARKYWQREVADEKERRGTGDPHGKD